jgi:hypothetical protein
MTADRQLPAANEFSPGQIDLEKLLALVSANQGDRGKIIDLIRETFFDQAATKQRDLKKRLAQQRTRAYNALLGASQYGLVDSSLTELTPLGQDVLEAPTDEEMYRLFARHIIRELGGFEVLLAVREMQASGLEVSKSSLQAHLESHGEFQLPRATTHHMKLLQWLRETDVLPAKGYEVSGDAVEEIADLLLDNAEIWATLTEEQKAFLRTLRRIALLEGKNDVPAKAVVDAVIAEYGPIFQRPDQLSASVFKPLADPASGWITHTVDKSGRGGKSGTVAATPKLLETEVDLLPEGDGIGIPPDLKARLRTPLDQVYKDLGSSDTHVKGIALELLALRIAIDLTLVPTRLRERGVTTGGAEVDLVAEAAHLHFSRWLLQCKNTAKVNVSALAKEVGMAVLLKAHVVVVVTTGTFSSAVPKYAKELASGSQLQAVLLDGAALAAYRNGGAAALRRHFGDMARQTLALKRHQVIAETGDS